MVDIRADAHAVLLPAFDGFTVEPWLQQLLAGGTRAILIGETRGEYVARAMSTDRRRRETAEQYRQLTDEVRRQAAGPVLVALDQEPWGTQRLHDLVPLARFSGDERAEEVADAAGQMAAAARRLGVNLFLSPVLDRLTGGNPWLDGRTLTVPPARLAEVASAFIGGVQAAGVAATAKHFPGFPTITADPAEQQDALVPEGAWDPEQLIPFKAAVAAGVRAVMTGPAPVVDVDPALPASLSPIVVRLLREEVGFTGVIVSDDLDAPATMQQSVPVTAVAAITAGVDLLLLAGDPEVTDVVAALVDAADREAAFAARLAEAADRVRHLADTLETH